MKTSTLIMIVLLVLVLGAFVFTRFSPSEEVIVNLPNDNSGVEDVSKPEVNNLSYNVDGDVFNLVDGKAEILSLPGSATMNSLSIFGEPVYGDLDADGDVDGAVWLLNEPGGTGVFYYGALVMNDGTGKGVATNTMFLGDRIAPQTLEVQDGRVVYNFAIRKETDPMTAEPSVGKSVWVNYDKNTGEIGEWVKDFEGEADPSVMKLDMKTWEWNSVTYNDGKKIVPKDPKKFTLTFKKDGSFSASTDCNGIGGNYKVTDKQIVFSEMLGTLMYCEGSQEGDFKKVLEQASSYFFTSKGELVFDLKFDSGSAIFK